MSLDQPFGRQPDHPVAPQFLARWSPRSFTGRALSEPEVLTLLEAARWAPSASNHQPWRFVWTVRGETAFDGILATLTGNNPVWAGKAGALVVVISKDTVLSREREDVPNRTAGFDTGAAWMSLALQAEAMGLVAHAMGGFDKTALTVAIALPEGHTLQAVVAVGEQGPAEDLPDGLREREKPSQRRSVAEFSVRGRF